MLFPPRVGDAFAIAGRRDVLTVAEKIAAFEDHERGEALYIVQAPAGSRWVLTENSRSDGPRWIGRPVPAVTDDVTKIHDATG